MKRLSLLLMAVMLLGGSPAWSGDVRVGADIHTQDLGFYVAVGVPFGLFYIDNYYYAPRGGDGMSLPTTVAPGTMSGPVTCRRDWSSTGTGMSFIGAILNTGIITRTGITTGGRSTGRTIAAPRTSGTTTRARAVARARVAATTIRPAGARTPCLLSPAVNDKAASFEAAFHHSSRHGLLRRDDLIRDQSN